MTTEGSRAPEASPEHASRGSGLRLEVTRQTLSLQRRSLIVWALSLTAMVALYTSLWPSIGNQPALVGVMEDLPEVLRSLLAGADMSTPAGYVQTELFALTGPLLIILYSVSTGAAAIAGEEERGRLDLLLANPVSRTGVVLEKAAAMVVGTVALAATIGVTLVLAAALGGPELSAGRVAAAAAHLALLGLVFGSAALAVGAATGQVAVARAVPAVLAVAAYAVNGLAPLVSWLEGFQILSPFYQYAAHQPLVAGASVSGMLVAAATSVVLVGVAVLTFGRRDVRVSAARGASVPGGRVGEATAANACSALGPRGSGTVGAACAWHALGVRRTPVHAGRQDTMDPDTQQAVGRAFGRLTITVAVIWAVAMLAAAVIAKASDDFFWMILVMLGGATVSGAVVEAARRRLVQ